MSDWTYSFLALPGFFIGLFLISRLGHLAQIFINPAQKSGMDTAERQPANRNQVLGALAIAAGWLAVFGALAFHSRSWVTGAIGWMWFFIGIAVTPCVLFPMTFYLWQREYYRFTEHIADIRELAADDSKYIYNIEFDESYINTMIDRYLQQEITIPSNESISVIAVLVPAVTWLMNRPGPGRTFLAITMALMTVGTLVLLKSATRKSLFCDLGYASHVHKRSTYTLSNSGLHVSGPRPPTPYPWPDMVEWPRFRKGVQFKDGILLIRAPVFVWLPNSALENAAPEEVARLVAKKLKLRVVGRS